MVLEIKKWDDLLEDVGEAYYFWVNGRFHSILESKLGTFRGDHTHPNRQCTLLLSGVASYYLVQDGKRVRKPLNIGEPFCVETGVPHILIPETDIITFEWWEGDFISEKCANLFDDLTKDRIGDE